MKKFIPLFLICLAFCAVFYGCSSNNDGEHSGASQSDDSGTLLDAYIAPALAVTVDMTAEDPSTGDMKFVYDEEGRITQCYYGIDDSQVYLSYTYKDGSAQIYGFIDELLVADENIDLPGDFDPAKGFSVIDGYYFKGF